MTYRSVVTSSVVGFSVFAASLWLWTAENGSNPRMETCVDSVATTALWQTGSFAALALRPSTWEKWSPKSIQQARATDASGRDYPLANETLATGSPIRVERVPPLDSVTRHFQVLTVTALEESLLRLRVESDSADLGQAAGMRDLEWTLRYTAAKSRLELCFSALGISGWRGNLARLAPGWIARWWKLAPFSLDAAAILKQLGDLDPNRQQQGR
ncbi:MAG: hypothetical protein AAB425_14750 [Bdellovibrionota bacterium]